MSNLKNRLKQASLNETAIATQIYMILEEAIRDKAKEMGYDQNENFDFEEVAVILDQNMGNNDTNDMAQRIVTAVEDWAEELQRTFPERFNK